MELRSVSAEDPFRSHPARSREPEQSAVAELPRETLSETSFYWGGPDQHACAEDDGMEKMGVVARCGGELGIVEYTELDDEHRYARDDDGELAYWAGSTAIHLLETSFVRRVARDAATVLPFHASAKKIPCLGEEGGGVEPSEPNGYKLERFVFDALPAAERAVIVEARREEEYSPVKNAEGGIPRTAPAGP